jgi:hypothetical protein
MVLLIDPDTDHPKPGDEIRVEPIMAVKDIKAIKRFLDRNVKPMDEIVLKEQETGKRRRISLNKSCVDAINTLMKSRDYSDDEPIFSG